MSKIHSKTNLHRSLNSFIIITMIVLVLTQIGLYIYSIIFNASSSASPTNPAIVQQQNMIKAFELINTQTLEIDKPK